MEGRLLLKNCSVLRADGRLRRGMAVVVEGERITRVADDAEVPVLPGDWEVACRGRLVTPGLVDCHAHLVGDLLVPSADEALAADPARALEVRRRREAALTGAEVEAITAFALAQAARSGITFVVEHLRCPNEVRAGLAAQAGAAERLGLRLANSHATARAPGAASAGSQLEGNAAYVAGQKRSALVRPALGFLSSSTCDEELLRELSEARRELRVGVHGHIYDGIRIASWLESLGLLGAGSIAACMRAPDGVEGEKLAATRTLLALSPSGIPPPERAMDLEAVLSHEGPVGLGTAGSGRLSSELEAAFTEVVQLARSRRLPDAAGALPRIALAGAAELCSELYGAPSGKIEAGALADLVVHDHVPAEEESGPADPAMLLRRSRAAWTVVNGRVVMREGQLLGSDFVEIAAEAARALESVWRRAAP